jgi:FKBP-type peptidyl-prolyl cis-trans isomerase (trigger factor)
MDSAFASILQRRLESGPLGRALTTRLPNLPDPVPPSLDGLDVCIPAPPEPTPLDLAHAFERWLWNHVPRAQRAPGEKVRSGDKIEVDALTFTEGKLLPRSPQFGAVWAAGRALRGAPGFAEALVGLPVGRSAVITLTLDHETPIPNAGGKQVHILLDVKAAWGSNPLTEEGLRALLVSNQMGATYRECMATLAAEQRALRQGQHNLHVCAAALDTLISRTKIDLPESTIDNEILRRWAEEEGKALALKKFSNEELQEALDGWLHDAGMRQQVSRDMQALLVLRSLVHAGRLKIPEGSDAAFLDKVAGKDGLTSAELKAEVEKSAELRSLVRGSHWIWEVTQQLLGHVRVTRPRVP